MSTRTLASTFAATIAQLVRNAQSPAQGDVVPRTITRARELVSAVHRVATASARDACVLLYATIRRAAHTLGYQRAATSGSAPAQPCAPAAGAAAVQPEATAVQPEATPVQPEMTVQPEPTAVQPKPTVVEPEVAWDHPPPVHAPMAASSCRGSSDPPQPPATTNPIAAPPAQPTPTTPREGASRTSELIEAIRVAIVQGATAEQKAIGAQATRTILAALDVEPGKPIVLPGAPKPHPLSGITVDQALDLVIARLTTIANARDAATAPKAATPQRERQGPQIPPQPERRGPQVPLVSRPLQPMPAAPRAR